MASLQRSEPQNLGRKPSWGRPFFASARLTLRQNFSSAGNFLAVVFAVVVVLAIGVVIVAFWTGLGDSDISPAGWIAMGFGVIITLVLGVGLMTLVFISSRRGYDELGRGSNAARPKNSDR
jgi:NADH:ubiquinone oxidoreductase subunit 6 (subunit J)